MAGAMVLHRCVRCVKLSGRGGFSTFSAAGCGKLPAVKNLPFPEKADENPFFAGQTGKRGAHFRGKGEGLWKTLPPGVKKPAGQAGRFYEEKGEVSPPAGRR